MVQKSFVFNGKNLDFIIISVTGDGACLFNMLSLAIYGTEQYSRKVRLSVVNYVVKNYDHFKHFITNIQSGIGMKDFQYAQYMSKSSTYGTYIEIVAAALVYKKRIVVFRSGILECDVGNLKWDCIFSEFIGNRDSGHFNLAIPIKPEKLKILNPCCKYHYIEINNHNLNRFYNFSLFNH